MLQGSQKNFIKSITVEEKIGSGHFGEVFKGQWEGSPVALKRISNSDTSLLNELSVLKHLNHPNIVRYFGVHQSSVGDLYLVMEYMCFGSLNNFLVHNRNELNTVTLIAM